MIFCFENEKELEINNVNKEKVWHHSKAPLHQTKVEHIVVPKRTDGLCYLVYKKFD